MQDILTHEDVRHRREALGYSQVELAHILDVPQATVSRWESGRHAIQHAAILDLALWALACLQRMKVAGAEIEPRALLKTWNDGEEWSVSHTGEKGKSGGRVTQPGGANDE